MTPDQPIAVVTDDAPRSASLTAAQSTVAVAERDMTLLVAAVAAVLNGSDTPPLSADDRARLRRLNTMLFRELSARGQREVRARTTGPDGTALRRSA